MAPRFQPGHEVIGVIGSSQSFHETDYNIARRYNMKRASTMFPSRSSTVSGVEVVLRIFFGFSLADDTL